MTPGYCSRFKDFTVGDLVMDFSDVGELGLGQIIKFNRHEVAINENENDKPPIEPRNNAANVFNWKYVKQLKLGTQR